jgi:hypothetical protein
MADLIRFLLENFALTLFGLGLVASAASLLSKPRPLTPLVFVKAVLSYFILVAVPRGMRVLSFTPTSASAGRVRPAVARAQVATNHAPRTPCARMRPGPTSPCPMDGHGLSIPRGGYDVRDQS